MAGHTEADTETAVLEPVVDRAKGLSVHAIERIASEVPLDRIISTIRDMLDADLTNDKPDWRAREIGVKLWLSYVIGLPVMRQHIVQEKINTAPATDALLANPANRDTLRRLLAQAEGDDKAAR